MSTETIPTILGWSILAQVGGGSLIDPERVWLLGFLAAICGSILICIYLAKTGRRVFVRKIAALEAVEEAVGRATEMGRSCLFVPGIQDLNQIDTVAGVIILGYTAEIAARYDATLNVPIAYPLVMAAAKESVSGAYLAAGRSDLYNEDRIYFVSSDQFGFVSSVAGSMVRDRPAACFYLGKFYAESLLLAETGNLVGAMQIAGTGEAAQLPFFVAACDYTLIGEEFFAASAYLSGDPQQLGSLQGQDIGKALVGALLIAGCTLATLVEWTGNEALETSLQYLRERILR
jgi:hypothetical protein